MNKGKQKAKFQTSSLGSSALMFYSDCLEGKSTLYPFPELHSVQEFVSRFLILLLLS